MQKYFLSILTICTICLVVQPSAAQDDQTISPDAQPTDFEIRDAHSKSNQAEVNRQSIARPSPDLIATWQASVKWLGFGLLMFAVVLFGAQFWLMFRAKNEWTEQSFKAFALTLILTTAMFLIIIGFDDRQLAPMVGLLGTLAGYVLGTNAAGK